MTRTRKRKPTTDIDLRKKLFREEMRRRRFNNILGYTVIALISTFLVLTLTGIYFPPFLRHVGIFSLGAGADCSKAANRRKPECLGPRADTNREWTNIRRNKKGQQSLFKL